MGNYYNEVYFNYYGGKNGGKNEEENLIFVHGSGCNRKFLRALAKKLPDFNRYLLDLPDHGRSERLCCTSVEEYIEAVAGFVTNMKNVTLIGHSLGGSICLGVAAKGLLAVKKCVIISSGAKFDKFDPQIYDMVKTQKVNWLYLLKCLGSLHCPAVLSSLLNIGKTTILQDFEIDIKLNLEDTLDKIHIPTLIMVSREDILTIPAYSRKMHQGIAGSRLVYFTKCRHMLPLARKKTVSDLIREFIRAK